MSSDITRSLIEAMPRMFVKYQTDPGRVSDVLQLPQLINLDMYLEMRLMTVSRLGILIRPFLSDLAQGILFIMG